MARLIAESARAQLVVALERGEATEANLDALAQAIGAGGAQAVALVEALAAAGVRP